MLMVRNFHTGQQAGDALPRNKTTRQEPGSGYPSGQPRRRERTGLRPRLAALGCQKPRTRTPCLGRTADKDAKCEIGGG